MGDPLQLRLGGRGGQGLQLSARLLADAVVADGRMVALSQSYEPTSRGGFSRADLVVADGAIDYPLVTALDWLVLLDELAVPPCIALLAATGTVLADRMRVTAAFAAGLDVRPLPFTEVARGLGDERIANVVALGALAARAALCRAETLEAVLEAGAPAKFLALNREALAAGWRLGAEAGAPPAAGHGARANTRT